MLTHEEVMEQLPALALGALQENEAAEVRLHLAGCASCRAELAAFQGVTGRLGLAVPQVAPPAGLKSRLMERVGERQPAAAGARQPAWLERLANLLRRPIPAWSLAGGAALALVLVLGVSLLLPAGEQAPLRTIALAGTAAAPDATGVLVISADGEYGSLVVDGLPDLDAVRQYQLWLIRNGQRVSGGVFSVHEGYAVMEIVSPQPLDSYDAFGITIEPAGGSPGPTGEKVLGST